MGRDDWYRSTAWNDEIAEAFEWRLARARDGRPQYLRIQAVCLLGSSDTDAHEAGVGLLHRLIEEYAGGDADSAMQVAGAHAHLAEHLAAVGQGKAAADHFEQALKLEADGYFKFGCELGLAELIVDQRWRERFEQVDELLDAVDALLPSDHFRIATVRARLAVLQGDSPGASAWARAALTIYEAQVSPFVRHPGVGVPKADTATIKELSALAGVALHDRKSRKWGLRKRNQA